MKINIVEPKKSALRPRKKVAAYARVSMETERLKHSLSAQISHYSAYIQKNPEWQYAGVFADDAISGTDTGKRDEFNRLMAACDAGDVDIILVKSISRFARNTVDLLETVRHLKSIGVDVWFEDEGIHSMDGDGELMLTILASFAQEESRSISENCKWGIRKRYENGQPRMCSLYGYRVKNGELVIEEAEAEIVRGIFQWFLDGNSCYEIARKLNKAGVKTMRGKDFCRHTIARMLRQEKYAGCWLMQKYYSENDAMHTRKKNEGEMAMYYAEETHPAIISREIFEAAQQEFVNRYGVEIRNGAAETAKYLCRGNGSTPPDYAYRRPQWTDEQRKVHSKKYKSRETNPYHRHELSLFLKCENCGENLAAQTRTFADGSKGIKWHCYQHYKLSPETPRPVFMDDEQIKKIIAEILELDDFSEKAMTEALTYISVNRDVLTFHFKDGHIEQTKYIPPKRGYRRKETS